MPVKIIQRIHRFIGMLAVVLILISAITGFFLLHSQGLALDKKKIHPGFFLWLYGKPKIYRIGDQIITEDYPPTWEKWLTRLHKGQFFGKHIPLVEDFLVLALLLLSITGVYLWFKARQFSKRAISEPLADNLDYLAIMEKLNKLKGKESEIKDRLAELHRLTEHLHHHFQPKDKLITVGELHEIEQHVKELDTKTAGIMKKIQF